MNCVLDELIEVNIKSIIISNELLMLFLQNQMHFEMHSIMHKSSSWNFTAKKSKKEKSLRSFSKKLVFKKFQGFCEKSRLSQTTAAKIS